MDICDDRMNAAAYRQICILINKWCLVLVVLVLISGCDKGNIESTWDEKRVLLEKYSSEFLLQSRLKYFMRHGDDEYGFLTNDGYTVVINLREKEYYWKHKKVEWKKQKRSNLKSLMMDVSIEVDEFYYWVDVINKLDTFLISTGRLYAYRSVHVSAYAKAPHLMVPDLGWFYVPIDTPHREHAVGTKNFLGGVLGYNDYFTSIKKLSEEWYYGERSK